MCFKLISGKQLQRPLFFNPTILCYSPKPESQVSSKISNCRPEPESNLDLGENIPLLQFLGYTFCPGNSVFGPWVKYSDYMDIYVNPRWVRIG